MRIRPYVFAAGALTISAGVFLFSIAAGLIVLGIFILIASILVSPPKPPEKTVKE